jgi:hypothetical protein
LGAAAGADDDDEDEALVDDLVAAAAWLGLESAVDEADKELDEEEEEEVFSADLGCSLCFDSGFAASLNGFSCDSEELDDLDEDEDEDEDVFGSG